ncbi:polyphosphate--glucose phosphotransferase [Streptomyces sp. NPDC020794]|uniref:polyphosphate--glucose phosphotransferase n=1 Tax=unclassified Streptomyces TaxID=2593676 RepID=UPI0036E8AE3B
MQAFGVDIGGTGIKGAPVDLKAGRLASSRYEVATPHPGKPEDVADAVRGVVEHFGWRGPVGVAFPGVVAHGITQSAANMHPGWVGKDAASLMAEHLDRPVVVMNDADAAGIAEMTHGAGRRRAHAALRPDSGPTIVLTLGTGIGSAVFVDDVLVPNTELGHLELDGHDAETQASARARKAEGLSWAVWGRRLERYLAHLEMLFCPGLFVLGGGISREADRFLPLLRSIRTPVVPAELHNDAGVVGAAMAAPRSQDRP